MSQSTLQTVVRQLCHLTGPTDMGSLSDGQLLQRFLAVHSEAAFETLTARHGPMVYGVCRRLLGLSQDAEDAFQATFLILVRKASSISPPEMVGNWLYGVAYRTALEARMRRNRRQAREKQVEETPAVTVQERTWSDLGEVVDAELQSLTDKYRAPIVLCDLQGRSRAEVAAQLAIPEGTLSSRVATGRKMLAKRLRRRCLALPAGLVASLLTQNALASPPMALVAVTTQAALSLAAGVPLSAGLVSSSVSSLTKGVLQAMVFSKLKAATVAILALALVAAGTAGSFYIVGPKQGTLALAAAAGEKDKDRKDKSEPAKTEKKTPATDPKTDRGADPKSEPKSEPKGEKPAPRTKKDEPLTPGLAKLVKQLAELQDQAKQVRRQMLAEIQRELKVAQEHEESVKEEGDKIRKSGKIADIRAHNDAWRKAQERVFSLRREESQIKMAMAQAGDAPKATPTAEQRFGLYTETPDNALAAHLGLKKGEGRIVSRLDKDAPAAKAGLKVYDLIVSINGKAIAGTSLDFRKTLTELKSDAPAEFVVLREGKRQTIRVSPGEP